MSFLSYTWENKDKERAKTKPTPTRVSDRSFHYTGVRLGPTTRSSPAEDNGFQLLPKLGQIHAAGTTPGVWAPPHPPSPAAEIRRPKGRHHVLLLSCPAPVTPNTPSQHLGYTRTTSPRNSNRTVCHFGRLIRPSSVTCLFSNFQLTFFLVK